MIKWEYKTIKIKAGMMGGGNIKEEELEDQLNRYGREGWEVVSCFDTSSVQGITKDVIVVFKRPVR